MAINQGCGNNKRSYRFLIFCLFSRSSNTPRLSKEVDGVVFEEVVHDPNFKYRIQKETGNTPEHVDPIYKIMYPGYYSTE